MQLDLNFIASDVVPLTFSTKIIANVSLLVSDRRMETVMGAKVSGFTVRHKSFRNGLDWDDKDVEKCYCSYAQIPSIPTLNLLAYGKG